MISFADIFITIFASRPKVLEQISKLLPVEMSFIELAEPLLDYREWFKDLLILSHEVCYSGERFVFCTVIIGRWAVCVANLAPVEAPMGMLLPNVDSQLCYRTKLEVGCLFIPPHITVVCILFAVVGQPFYKILFLFVFKAFVVVFDTAFVENFLKLDQ